MDGYIQTLVGIMVSVALFLIGYRQTIGARRERIKSANQSIYKALLRRVVLEEYTPKSDDVNRLINGKAQEFKVNPGDLSSEEQFLTQIFAGIFDNDFITQDQRVAIEGRITPALNHIPVDSQDDGVTAVANPDKRRARVLLLSVLAVLASIMGALASLVLLGDRFTEFDTRGETVNALIPVFTVFIASMVSVIAISVVKRARERPDDLLSRSNAMIDGAQFEHQVAAILTKLRLPFQIEPRLGPLRPDFLADVGGKHVAIEVKSWRTPPPMALISRTARYMQELLKLGGIEHAIVVTRGRLPGLERRLNIDKVQFVAYRDLEGWLKLQISGA